MESKSPRIVSTSELMPGVNSFGCIDHGPIVPDNFKCFFGTQRKIQFLTGEAQFCMKVAEMGLLWPGRTHRQQDSKKWSLIINNDACLPFCWLFILYFYCLLTGCFCPLKRSDWTLRTSWARPRSQLKQCPLSTIQNNIFTVCGGQVLANPAPLLFKQKLFDAIPNPSKIRRVQKV
jgi:hypothetical protein